MPSGTRIAGTVTAVHFQENDRPPQPIEPGFRRAWQEIATSIDTMRAEQSAHTSVATSKTRTGMPFMISSAVREERAVAAILCAVQPVEAK